jgi:hypothetical protein
MLMTLQLLHTVQPVANKKKKLGVALALAVSVPYSSRAFTAATLAPPMPISTSTLLLTCSYCYHRLWCANKTYSHLKK